MVVGKATTSTSSRASSSRLPPAPMTLGTSTRFLLVATRVPDRRMQSHSEYAYYKPSPWTSSPTSSPRSAQRASRRTIPASCRMSASAQKRTNGWTLRYVRFVPLTDPCSAANDRIQAASLVTKRGHSRYHSITPVGEILKRWLDGAVSHKQRHSKRRRRRGRERGPRRTRAALL